MRVYIKISYDGSRFYGFQKQKEDVNTVMREIYKALLILGIKSEVVGSGRTDKGVHANSQAIHVDLPEFWSDLKSLKVMLNRHIHPFIHVKKIYPVKNHFHARFSPIKREYRYVFCHDKYSPTLSSYVHFYPKFDIKKLSKIVSIFKGEHDFEFFKKSGSGIKKYRRKIYEIKPIEYKNRTIIVIKANSFLRSQIRMIISSTLKVYEDKLTLQEVENQLFKKSITTQSVSPPNGLYLHRIYYKKDIYL